MIFGLGKGALDGHAGQAAAVMSAQLFLFSQSGHRVQEGAKKYIKSDVQN